MSNTHHRREEIDDMERNRYRDRRRSRSRTPERYSRRRRSYSRSRSRDESSGRYYHSSSRDKRGSRYRSRRYSVSRSRSKSHSRRASRSHSRSYSRTRRHSRTPTGSYQRRRSRSNERKTDFQHNKKYEDCRERKQEISILIEDNKGNEIESDDSDCVEQLPLPPKKESLGAYYNLDTDEPIDKEKIHREMEEKLRATLAKEGKVYPPKKPEASHPVFANDGSFIEIFKKMQQAQQPLSTGCQPKVLSASAETASTSAAAAYVAATSAGKPAPPPPIVGRRRGGKILKTGVVAKPKAQGDDNGDPKDFWSIYLREVNKYKNNACDSDGGTRPLVK